MNPIYNGVPVTDMAQLQAMMTGQQFTPPYNLTPTQAPVTIDQVRALIDERLKPTASNPMMAQFEALIQRALTPDDYKQLSTTGLFSHLKAKGIPDVATMEAPSIVITMQKFATTVAPSAEKMEIQLGHSAAFVSITTAVDPDAPKLFQWDHSFAWYLWHGGAAPSQYGLSTGWVSVSGITRLPARWDDEEEQRFRHHGDGIIMMLDGARETRVAGAALFPSCMRSELREVRSVIESYSRGASMEGLREGSAIGIDLRESGSGFPVAIRVTKDGRSQTYKIDRWD
jgi:hypothetical protein